MSQKWAFLLVQELNRSEAQNVMPLHEFFVLYNGLVRALIRLFHPAARNVMLQRDKDRAAVRSYCDGRKENMRAAVRKTRTRAEKQLSGTP